MNRSREPQQTRATDQSIVEIGPPRKLVQRVVSIRVEPPLRYEVLLDVRSADQLRQDVEEPLTRDFVAVYTEHPVAAALSVQPRKMALDASAPLETNHAIRVRCVVLELRLATPGVRGDNDFVGDIAENREQRPDARPRFVGAGTDGERHLTSPFPTLGERAASRIEDAVSHASLKSPRAVPEPNCAPCDVGAAAGGRQIAESPKPL